MTRFARGINIENKNPPYAKSVEVFADSGEDVIAIVIDIGQLYPVTVEVTTQEALDLINTIRAAIDECELEQFIEVNS